MMKNSLDKDCSLYDQTNVKVVLKSILDFEKNKFTLLIYLYIVSRILLKKKSSIIVIETSK